MSQAESAVWSPTTIAGRWLLFGGLVLFGAVAIAAAAVVSNGSIVVTLAPLAAATMVVSVCLLPIRLPLYVLFFLGIGLDATGEGPWNSPVSPAGRLLLQNLNKTIPVNALAFQGVTVILFGLLALYLYRRLSNSPIDSAGCPGMSPPMAWTIGLSLTALLGLIGFGLINGGDAQMAKIQVQTFAQLLLFASLLAGSLRGAQDYRVLAWLVMAATCLKAVMAMWSAHLAPAIGPGFYATVHGDSLLFACAITLVVVAFCERPTRGALLLALVVVPIAIAGISANNRRLAYVEVAAAVGTYFVLTERPAVKRIVSRGLLALVPVIAIYAAVGWNADAPIFAPIKLVRSIGDSDVDRSTLFRDLENYNLLFTLRTSNPVVGTGFGHPYNEEVTLDDISTVFKEYRYMPHNSVLGLWGFTGLAGFSALWLVLVVGILLAARSYRVAKEADGRIAAYMALAMIIIHLIQCWGDIGFAERKSLFMVGAAIALAGQLASSTGAWSTRSMTLRGTSAPRAAWRP